MPEGEKSIEELAAAQAAFDNEQQQRKEEEAERIAEEAKLKQQAGAGVYRREEVIGEMKTLDQGIKQAEADGIDTRLERAEAIKADILTRQEELLTGEADLAKADERLTQLAELTEGRDQVIPEITAEIAKARDRHSQVKSRRDSLVGEISGLQGQIVSDEQAQNYQKLLDETANLNQEISGIEANPALIELIYAEAKSEDDIRNRIVSMAQNLSGYGGRSTPEKNDFISTVVQKFLSIDFAREKCDMLAKKQDYATYLALGLSQNQDPNHVWKDETIPDNKKSIMLRANALKSMIGKHGTSDSFAWLALSARNLNPERSNYDEVMKEELGTYLPIYNYILAQNEGLGEYFSGQVIGQFSPERMTGDSHKYGMERLGKGTPIIPTDATEVEKMELKETYEREVAQGKALAIQMWEKARADLATQIETVRKELEEAKGKKSSREQAEIEIKNRRVSLAESPAEIKDRINSSVARAKKELDIASGNLEDAKRNQQRANFLRRGRIAKEVSEAEQRAKDCEKVYNDALEVQKIVVDNLAILRDQPEGNLFNTVRELENRLSILIEQQERIETAKPGE